MIIPIINYVYTIQTTYLELMHFHPYYFLFTQIFPWSLLVKIYFFNFLVSSFFHAHVHGQCPATAKYIENCVLVLSGVGFHMAVRY